MEDSIFFADRLLKALRAEPVTRDERGNFTLNTEQTRALEADWIAAVVKYYRCFSDGVRTVLNPAFFAVFDGAAQAHQYFLNVRNKHVIHAINGFEQAKTFVNLPAKGKLRERPIDVGWFTTRRSVDGPENVEAFLNLAKIAKSEASKLLQESANAFLVRAKSENLETLYACPYASITTTGGGEGVVAKRPNRSRGGRSG